MIRRQVSLRLANPQAIAVHNPDSRCEFMAAHSVKVVGPCFICKTPTSSVVRGGKHVLHLCVVCGRGIRSGEETGRS
jgi:hypothetical protein